MSATQVDALVSIHKALLSFDKRAERITDEILEATFVDSAPLFDLLYTKNNQIIYGRRGTGKTHALKYLARQVERAGDWPIYVDLRSVGSNGSIYSDGSRPLSERAITLILDVLTALHGELYSLALDALDRALDPHQITLRLDDFANSISNVRLSGSVEMEAQSKDTSSIKRGGEANFQADAEKFGGSLKYAHDSSKALEFQNRVKRTGVETVHINFGNIGTSLGGLISVVGVKRLWLLIDEWSEVPFEIQPYLADLFRRTIIPIGEITVKIAAIEHRSMFSTPKANSEYVGLELGADVAADLNLDDFLVFDSNRTKATEFFKTLLYKHYRQSEWAHDEIDSANRLVQLAFTQGAVFEEFVTAVEGVPRDALNLAAKIATKAYGNKIAMQHVRGAARDWYQQDKHAVIRSNKDLQDLLTRIVDDIIGRRRARAFLFLSNYRSPAIDKLFDARLLHVLKRNISSHDEPGVRYDVYKIDYGCYVDLINTIKSPQGLFSVFDGDSQEDFVEVPKDDYRSIRGAILRPENLDTPF